MTSSAAIARVLPDVQREVVLGLTTDRSVRRAGIAGAEWHITPVNLSSRTAQLRFSESLIAKMIRDGLLYVTQATGPLPRNPEGVKFSARLSRTGFEVRQHLLDAGHGTESEQP